MRRDRFLWVVLAVGAALRLYRIAGDLPYVFHYDEPTLIDNAVWLIQHRSLNPHFFNYPTGLIYLLAVLFGAVALGGAALGRFDGIHGAIAWLGSRTYPQPPEGGVIYFYPTIGIPVLYLIGRIVSVAAGLAAIALVYEIARRAGGRRGSDAGGASDRRVPRIAALAVALSPLAVEHSRLATTDMTATALACACVLAALMAEGAPGARRWILAGALGGLAAGVKYNAGLAVVVLPLLAVWRLRTGGSSSSSRTAWRNLALSAAAALAAFIVTTPYALLDFPKFAKDLGYEIHRVGSVTASFQGAEAVEATSVEKIAEVFGSNLGILGVVAAIWGAVVALRKRRFAPAAVIAWAVVLILPPLRWKSLYARYLLLAWPAILILGSLGIADATDRLGRLLRRHRSPAQGRAGASPPTPVEAASLVLACILVLAPGAVRLAKLESRWTGRDPRVEMTDWIERNVPAGERIVSESAAAFPDPDRYAIDRIDFLGRSTPDAYRARGIRYLVTSGRERLILGKDPFRGVIANLEAIRASSDVAWSSGRYAVYRLRGAPAWQDSVRTAIASGGAGSARTILERAVRSPGGDIPFAWKSLAEARAATGDSAAAVDAWTRAAREDTSDVEPLLALGYLATSMRQWDAAIAHLERARRISPRDPLTNHELAVAHLYRARDRLERRHDREGARADWEAARESASLAAKVSPGDPSMPEILDQAMRAGRRWGFIGP